MLTARAGRIADFPAEPSARNHHDSGRRLLCQIFSWSGLPNTLTHYMVNFNGGAGSSNGILPPHWHYAELIEESYIELLLICNLDASSADEGPAFRPRTSISFTNASSGVVRWTDRQEDSTSGVSVCGPSRNVPNSKAANIIDRRLQRWHAG